jgi:hypothetical protein
MEIHVTTDQWSTLCSQPSAMIAFWENQFSKILSEGMAEDEMQKYNSEQLTLIAYLTFRQEMLEGGMIQLIYNGYGPFVFFNPFAKAMRLWGLSDFASFINKANKIYLKHREEIEGRELSDKDFMALYELHPEMDKIDDVFVESEPEISHEIANFVASNPSNFGIVIK